MFRSTWGIPILRMIDETGKIIKINSLEPIEFENNYFKGIILPMIKCDGEYEEYNTYGKHLSKSNRKFEIQFQGQIKYIPKGIVVVGGELEKKIDIGYFTSILLSTLVSFSMALNSLLKVGFGEDIKENNDYEQPHIVFPLFRVMDRVIISNLDEELPILGQEIPESDIERDKRRNGDTEFKFETDKIYTFSFHTSFIDFANWTLCGFPGYSSIDIRTFLGIQSPRIVVYELSPTEIELKDNLSDNKNNNNNISTIQATSASSSSSSLSYILTSSQPFHKNHPINKKKYLANLQLDYIPKNP